MATNFLHLFMLLFEGMLDCKGIDFPGNKVSYLLASNSSSSDMEDVWIVAGTSISHAACCWWCSLWEDATPRKVRLYLKHLKHGYPHPLLSLRLNDILLLLYPCYHATPSIMTLCSIYHQCLQLLPGRLLPICKGNSFGHQLGFFSRLTHLCSQQTKTTWLLTHMLLVANLAYTKWCKKTEKWLKPWHMGIHLRELQELSNEYQQHSFFFLKSLHPYALGDIGRDTVDEIFHAKAI